MAVFMLQQQSCIVATETVWPAKPTILDTDSRQCAGRKYREKWLDSTIY